MNWLRRLLKRADSTKQYMVTYDATGERHAIRSHGTKVIAPYGIPSGDEIEGAIKADLNERGTTVDQVDITGIYKLRKGGEA